MHGSQEGKLRSASEGRLQLDGGFLKNEAIHCCKNKSNCQIEPMKIPLPSYCEATHSGVLSWMLQLHSRHLLHKIVWKLPYSLKLWDKIEFPSHSPPKTIFPPNFFPNAISFQISFWKEISFQVETLSVEQRPKGGFPVLARSSSQLAASACI